MVAKPLGRAERQDQGIVSDDRHEMTPKTRRCFKTAACPARRRDGRRLALEAAGDTGYRAARGR